MYEGVHPLQGRRSEILAVNHFGFHIPPIVCRLFPTHIPFAAPCAYFCYFFFFVFYSFFSAFHALVGVFLLAHPIVCTFFFLPVF